MTKMVDGFGTLHDVEVTSAWAFEATQFTPWLADNLDRLSEALNIPLDLVGREVSVGRFKADIIAVNSSDETNVLIENQLDQSDHRHIGQILTYLAGLDAKTVIWIAPHFRDEHLSAVRWLNQHTGADFAFFAVKLRVVRIGDSLLAPLFDVLEKPNNWERNLQRTTKEAVTASEKSPWRQQFWERYVQLYPNSAVDRGGGGRGASRWRNVPGTDYIVSRWVGEGSVGLFIRGERGRRTPEVYDEFFDKGERLSTLIGNSIGDDVWYPFLIEEEIESQNSEHIDDAIHWLEEKTQSYVGAMQAYVQQADLEEI